MPRHDRIQNFESLPTQTEAHRLSKPHVIFFIFYGMVAHIYFFKNVVDRHQLYGNMNA